MTRWAGLFLSLWAPVLLAAGRFEKSIPVPRAGEARLGWTNAGCSVRSVSLQNYPGREDIHRAHIRAEIGPK